jgi:SAM-dependent methyltransferase
VSEEILAEQIHYYRQRAAEYDATSYQDLVAARARIEQVLAALAPSGRILEIACGTGMWTQSLARAATELTALDSAPEVIAIARERCPASVRFEVADLFSWQPVDTYDTVFAGFFLSHVPSSRLDALLATIGDALAPGGRILIVDEHTGVDHGEVRRDDDPEIATRTLTDGSAHRLVKVFLDPVQLKSRLARLGLRARFEVDDDWLIGEVSR